MSPGPVRRDPARRPWRALVAILWRSPIIGVAFGFFFWLLGGRQKGSFTGYALVGTLFAYTISLSIWLGESVLYERVVRPGPGGRRPVFQTIVFYGFVSVGATYLSAYLAGLILHVRLLASGSGTVIFLLFTLIFSGLALSINLAITFYRETMDKVREEEELSLARRIQQSFLPERFPVGAGFEVHAVNRSSKQVSGDFYDVMPAGRDGLLLAIADVSGKGFPAALLGSMLQASLRTQAGEKDSTAAITGTVNALTTGAGSTGKFVTLFLAHFDPHTLRLRYTNAGHNPPLLFRASGGHETLEEGGIVVGAFAGFGYAEGDVQLYPGDRLVFYTDGVTEAQNARGEMFGEERLIGILAGLPRDLSSRAVVERALAEVDAFLADLEPGDDITMMVLRIPEAGGRITTEETTRPRGPGV